MTLSQGELTVLSAMLLSSSKISPSDAVADVMQLASMCPPTTHENSYFIVKAACILISAEPELSPQDALGDALQLWELASITS